MVAEAAVLIGGAQQRDHGLAFVEKEPDVAPWFGGLAQGSLQSIEGRRPVPLRLVGEGLHHEDLDEASTSCGFFGGLEQPVQQADCLADRAGVPVHAVLRDEQTHQSEVVELAQVADVVHGGQAAFAGPLGSLRELALGDPDARPHRRDRPYVREEAAPVAKLSLVEQVDGSLQVTLGFPDSCHGHEPPVPVLRRRRTLPQRLRGLEVPGRFIEVSQLAVELAEADVQVGGGQRPDGALCAIPVRCLTQGTFIESARPVRSSSGEPHVRQDAGAAQRVGKMPGQAKAPHSLGERLQGRLDVAVRPGREPEEPGSRAAREVVVRPGHLERALRVVRRTGHVTAGLGERRPVDGQGHRQSVELLIVGARRTAGSQRPFRVVEPTSDRVEVPGDHQHPAVEDAEHGASPDHVVGERVEPAEDRPVLPVASHRGQRQLHQVRRAVEVPGSQCVPDRVLRQVVVLVPVAGAPVQHRDQVGVLAEHAGAEHVGEQVVVAGPLPLVVEGDNEEVGSIETLEHHAAVGPSRDGVAQRSGEPVEDGGVQQELADVLGLVLQHLVEQVVQDEAVAAGERADESGDVAAAAQRQGDQLQSGDPAFRAGLERVDVRGGKAETHDLVQEALRLVRREAQVGGAQLSQRFSSPQAGQRERRIRATRDQQVQLRRKVVEQERHGLVHWPCVDHVVVIEHEHDLPGCPRHVVDERSQRRLDRQGRRTVQ